MSETEIMSTPIASSPSDAGNMPMITYVLYLVGLLIGPATLVGLIMAYVAKGDAPEWAQTHYRWLIRTFWISLVWGVIGVVTAFLVIGYVILLVGVVWYLVRVIRGFVAMQKKQPIANPASWGF